MKNMDVDTVAACNAGAEIEFLHPVTNQPTGMFVTIVGKDSDIWQQLTNDSIDKERRRQFMAQKKGKVAEPRSKSETDREVVEMLAAGTTGFRDVVLDGEPLPFSEENAIKLYTKRPAFKQQVDEAIANLENFIKG